MRIDVKMVQDKLVPTRSKALNTIKNGVVFLNGKLVTKAGQDVKDNDKIEIAKNVNPFVSRGGMKLEKAINIFKLDFKDKIVIDIGSSTGGFTDCAIKYGAKKVYAIDVGNGQLDNTLKQNSKVKSMENTDFRKIDNKTVKDANLIVCDASFISITKFLPKICELNINTLVMLVKPQFECGKEIATKYKGVIKNKKVHLQVLKNILNEFKNYGYFCENLSYSPITGGDGNIEYIALFTNKFGKSFDLIKLVDNAFACFG